MTWKMNLRKKDTKLLHKMDAGWANMEMDKDGKLELYSYR